MKIEMRVETVPSGPRTWKDVMKISVMSCARCTEDHKDLELKRFWRPVETEEGLFPQWAMCPTRQEPILVRTTFVAGVDGPFQALDVDPDEVGKHGPLGLGEAAYGKDVDKWAKKIGKKLGVDPRVLPKMKWSEFNQLASSQGLTPVIVPVPKRTSAPKKKRTKSKKS